MNTNIVKTLGVIAFLVGAFFTCRLYANADPETIDQPDLNGVICGQLALGGTSDGIADQARRYFRSSFSAWARSSAVSTPGGNISGAMRTAMR